MAYPQIDSALAVLQANKDSWVTLPLSERLAIVDELLQAMTAVAARWVAAGLTAKGLALNTPGEAEEWLFLATILRALRLLRQSLHDIQQNGRPHIAGPVSPNEYGQLVAGVFPQDAWDRLLFRGITGEVRFEPGVTAAALRQGQARAYREAHAGKVALVLGAGNASMLPVIDMLHKLFVEGQVVALKPNPINAYLGPLIEEAFAALTRRGFLRLVYGGTAEGAYLCHHTAVDEIHLTGSARTFEAITFGPGAAGAARRAPALTKRFTCELGNVSPVIIVPGPWTAADVQEQAEQIATWFVANAGFGCLTPRLIIQQQGWPQRQRLIDAIERVLAGVATRPAYYPGAAEIHAAFLAQHPEARQIGLGGNGRLPWTLIPGVNPANREDICFRREAFCSLCAETALETADAVSFLDQAVEFANSTLWGTLNATLIVHPLSLRAPEVAAAVERAIARLRYGTVLINMGAFAGYYLQVTPWGGFPGHDLYDIQSGVGKTANLLMLEQAQKSVVRGPFRKQFDAVRVTSRQMATFCRKLAYFEAARSPWRVPSMVWAALRH